MAILGGNFQPPPGREPLLERRLLSPGKEAVCAPWAPNSSCGRQNHVPPSLGTGAKSFT